MLIPGRKKEPTAEETRQLSHPYVKGTFHFVFNCFAGEYTIVLTLGVT